MGEAIHRGHAVENRGAGFPPYGLSKKDQKK